MSPRLAPKSDEPYCSTACFSSAIWRALTEKLRLLRTVEAGDHGVELLADLEAVGALLVAVAAEVAALDEAGRAVVAGLHFEPAVANFEHGHRDDVVLLQAARAPPALAPVRRPPERPSRAASCRG